MLAFDVLHVSVQCDNIDKNLLLSQMRSQEFAEGNKRGCLETEVPQRGPGAEPRWGFAPRSRRHVLNIRLNEAIDRHKLRTVQSPIIL